MKKIKYLIVEGFFTLTNAKLRSLFDEVIWIKTDEKEAYSRRLVRDRDVRKHPLFMFLTKSGNDGYQDIVKPIVQKYYTIVTDNDFNENTMSRFVQFYLEKCN